jgi:hypothetical protein
MHQGLPCVTGESGSVPQISNRNSCLPDVPQVVVVVKSLSLRLLLPPRFLNIAKYNNECSCSAHEDAKIIKVCYLRF